MSTLLEVILRARNDISPAVKEAIRDVEALGRSAAKVNNFKALESAGNSTRNVLAATGNAARLFGVDISSVAAPVSIAADAVADLTKTFEGMGRAQLVALGAVGVLVSGFAILNEAMLERNRAIETGIRQNDNWVKSMEAFARGNESATRTLDDLVRAMAQVETGWSWDLGDVIDRWMQFDQVGRGVQQALNLLGIELGDLHPALESSADKVGRLTEEMSVAAAAALELQYAIHAAQQPIRILGDTRGEAISEMREGKRAISEMNTEAWHLKYEFKEGVGWIERIPRAAAGANSALQRLNQAAQRFKGLVETALTPTAADPNMGDAWDEARKRFEAFATGTDIGAYGTEFQKLFESLGMGAEEAARKFKDFSLFADPAMLQKGLIDWGPIAASVEQQLLSIAGKANVTSEAMRQVWANLSPTAKAALAEQGIDSASDAMKELVDPAGAAQSKVAELGSAMSAIPRAITTTFAVVTDTAKAAIQDLAEFLDKFIGAYGTVHVSAQGEFGAPSPPPPDATIPKMAFGGYAQHGLYELGETGPEFVLPAGLVSYIESVLGRRIKSPDEIGWLVGALKRGPEETANQLQMWESGIAGWGVDANPKAGKWTDKIYARYERMHGAEGLPDSVRNTGGSAGAGAGAGGGTTVNVSLLNVDADMLAKAIVKEIKPYLEIDENALIKRLKDAISREIGRGAFLRSALRT